MAHIGSYLPSPGSAVWRRDVGPVVSEEGDAGGGGSIGGSYSVRVCHVQIRDAEIREEPAPYVEYRIDVQVENDHWYLFRRYSQFYSLHKRLMKHYGIGKDLLPPKKMSGNLSKQLIDKRRKLLERYLQKLIHSDPQVSRSPELQVFLDSPTHDVIKVTDILTRHLYRHGNRLLEDATPISLSINEMYAITLRLQLPVDTPARDDVEADPVHLYEFVHQLQRLRISPPPRPCSVSCSTFDLSPFRSLNTLKLDYVKMSQVNGLQMIQQQLQRLAIQFSLHSLEELLVDGVEEKRRGSTLPGGGTGAGWEARSPSFSGSEESWRLASTAKLTNARTLVQSWYKLHTLTLSHNFITHLDNSLEVLPVLCELTLNHNCLQVLSLPYLCLPSLEKLNVSHNQIHAIDDKGKVLERITHLNISHNCLYSLDGIKAFVGVYVLNLSFNRLVSSADISKVVRLRRLTTLGLAGNPISSTNACRVVVLAKFLHKSRELPNQDLRVCCGRKSVKLLISLDGVEASGKERAKIKAYTSKYGAEPELWPVAKPLVNLEREMSIQHHDSKDHGKRPHPLSVSEPGLVHQQRPPGPVSPSTPHIDLSWQAQVQHQSHSSRGKNSGSYLTGGPSPLPHLLPDTATQPALSSLDSLSLSSSSSRSSEHSVPRVTPDMSRRSSEGPCSLPGRQRVLSGSLRSLPSTKVIRKESYSATPNEERYSVGVAYRIGARGETRHGHLPRSEPDGQSDISGTSPDLLLHHPDSSHDNSATRHPLSAGSGSSPPPSSPTLTAAQPHNDGGCGHTQAVTPVMIQSALDALEGIQDKDTPISLRPPALHLSLDLASRQSPVLPEDVASALTAWISSQSLHNVGLSVSSSRSSVSHTPLLTPPPTPKQMLASKDSPSGTGRQGISAGDLITALTALICPGTEKALSSRESHYAVPACTPQEGLSEWARLGIRPEEVIHALAALTIQQEEEGDSHRTFSQRLTESPQHSCSDGNPAGNDGNPSGSNGNPSSNDGNPSSNIGNPSSNIGNPSSNDGNPSSNIGNPSSNIGNPSSNDGNPSGNDGNPSGSDENLSSNDGNPSSNDGNPSSNDGNPSSNDGNPSSNDGNPNNSDGNPSGSDGNPNNSDGNPNNSDGNPYNSDGNPYNSDGNPYNSDGNPYNSDGNPYNSDGNSSSNDESTNFLRVIPEGTVSVHPEGVVSGINETGVAKELQYMGREELYVEEEGSFKVHPGQGTSEAELSELDPFISGNQNDVELLGHGESLGDSNPFKNADPLTCVDPLDCVNSSGNIAISGHVLVSSSPSADVTGKEDSPYQSNAERSGAHQICHPSQTVHAEEVEHPAGSHEVVDGPVRQLESVLYTNA